MRTLKMRVERDGFEFNQVWRSGRVAVFEQRLIGAGEPAAWEVWLVRVGKAHPKDADQSDAERGPSCEEWGSRGWTFLTLMAAKEKAWGLVKENADG